MREDLTQVEQKAGLSRNLSPSVTDKRGPRLSEPSCEENARPTPGSLMAVTPRTRSWNEFSALIEEWEALLRLAA
ncbi:MAG: hypothetical protein WAU39_18240 [Polyangiales bacterium]